MRKMKAAALVLDFDLYPRSNMNQTNITDMAGALTAGVELPPVIIDRKSKRVVDGFHRVRAHQRVYGDEAEVMVIEKTYRDDSAMFLDAMRYNSSHGYKLGSHDRTHCVIVAERLSIPVEAVAGALCVTVDKLGDLKVSRTAIATGGLTVPLKRTVSRQFAGRILTKRQEVANEKLSGMNQVFYANQLIELFESEMIDTSDEQLIERLRTLGQLIDGLFAVK